MKKLKTITDQYPSLYRAAIALQVNAVQLKRWLDKDAYFSSDGELYTKALGKINPERLK